VDNNYLDLSMNKSGFVHTLPSGRLKECALGEWPGAKPCAADVSAELPPSPLVARSVATSQRAALDSYLEAATDIKP
jgi:hypothetical protein